MAEKITAKTAKTKKYVAISNCVFNNRWVARGTIIELPADEVMTHDSFKEATSENTAFVTARNSGVYYDPTQDAIASKRINDVMAGVVRK